MRNNEKVTIIIPAYNAGKYIGDCLKSCLVQTYEDFEVVVVDDGSTDNTYDVIMSFEKDMRIVPVRFEENKGFVAARNQAIRQAHGDFIIPIDSDDMLTPRSLEVRLNAFQEHPELDFVHGVVYDDVPENATYNWCMKHLVQLCKSPRTQRQFTKEHKHKIHAQGMMFRYKVFERYGLYYNIHSKPDKEMMYRLGIHPLSPIATKVKFKKINKFVAFYRRHEGSMKSSLSDKCKAELKQQLDDRMLQLIAKGLNRSNTPWL